MAVISSKRLERATAETLQEARRDIAVEILNSVIPSICALFMEVNAEPDPQERINRFAKGADKIVDEYLGPQTDGRAHGR